MQHIMPADMRINDLYVSKTHMGVVTGPGMGFAARSTASGTGPQPVGSGYDILRFPGGGGKIPGWLQSITGKVGNFLGNLFGGGKGPAGGEPMGGPGVQKWAPLVSQALSLMGLPQSLIQRVLFQMQSESGGNPRAINLTDINAAHGDPSKGLMQVIGSTFRAYHVAGTSWNIYDPLANIAAAIAYASNRYGPALMSGGRGIGSGHGYAAGTPGAAPGWGWVGERGPELVNFKGGETVIPAGGLGGYATGTLSAADIAREHAAAARRVAAAATKMGNAGASLAASIAKLTKASTPATFAADQAKFLKDLRLYFSPNVANARSRLVIGQINTLKSLQGDIKKLSGNIAQANAYQQEVLTHLRGFGGVAAIGLQGTGATAGRSILTGLQSQVSTLRGFGTTIRDLSRAGASAGLVRQVAAMDPAAGTAYGRSMITALKKLHAMHAPAGIINSVVAAGPEAANAYADALRASSAATRRQIFGAEASLEAARLSVSRGVASVVSGGAYITGANFVAGLKMQQKQLEYMFAHLGKTLGQEAVKWFRVPANKRPYGYQHGGWINEPISGFGLYSGAAYTFAEAGPEYVIEHGAAMAGARGGDGASYHAHFDGLTRAAIESHVQTAFQAMSIQQGQLSRPGRRS